MKKTKVSKRLLSLLLSALMIVTSVPLTFAPIVAQAAVTATTYGSGVTYLDSASDTGFTGTATWDSTYNAWSFNGSQYLKLNDTPLKGVTTSSGFAISFEVYNPSHDTANKFFSFSNGSARISMDCGSGDWWTRYRTEISDGTSTRGYYTSDFTSEAFCSKTNNANGNDSYPTNNWYTMTVVMNTDGSFSYYRNTDLLATFKSNYISTSNGGGLSDANAAAAIDGLTTYVIGASDTSGTNGFTGYIKNFKVYNSKALWELDSAIKAYETKMNGTVYTNMAAAYKAYVDACEAYDAAVYGGSTTAQLAAATTALTTATGNMTTWTAKTANNPAAADGSYSSSTLVAGDEMKNVLYTYGVYSSAPYNSDSSVAKCYVGFQYGAIVFLYNGTEMACPINAYVHRNGSGTRRCRSIAPITSGFSLKHNWHSNESTGNIVYQGTTGVIGYVDGDTSNASLNMESGTYYYSNALYLNLASMANYSASYTPQFCFRDNNGNYGTNTTGGTVSQGDQTIYVLNYKALTDAVTTKVSNLPAISNYKENANSNMLTVMEDIDDATSFDPNSYFSGTVTVANTTADNSVAQLVDDAATEISGIVTQLGNHTPTPDNADDYIALRNAIDYSGEPTGIDGGDFDGTIFSVREIAAAEGKYNVVNNKIVLTSSGAKTLTGYDTFETAYNNAISVMAALGSAGYNTNTDSNYTDATAATKATALMSAFNALSAIDLNKPTTSGNTYLGPSDTISVTDTNDGDATYDWEYSTNGGTNWTSGTSGTGIGRASTTFTPFSNAALVSAGTVLIRVKATKSTATEYDNSAGVSYTYFTAPTVTVGGNALSNNQILTDSDTISFASTKAGASGTLQYSLNGGAWTNGSSITPFSSGAVKATIQVRETASGSTSEATATYTVYNKPSNPKLSSDGAYVDNSHGVSAALNDGNDATASTLEYSADGTNFSTYEGKIIPFDGAAENAASTSVTSHFRTSRTIDGVTAYSNVVSVTQTYLTAPTYSVDNYAELTSASATVSFTNNANGGTAVAGGTLYYSLDGGSWTEGSSVQPFNGSSALTRTIQAKVVGDGGETLGKTITVIRNFDVSAAIYFAKSGTTQWNNGKFEGESGDKFKVAAPLSSYTTQTIYYQDSVDGGDFSNTFKPYLINEGIDASTYARNKIVKFRFYITNVEGKTIVAEDTFINNNTNVYKELLFHESFDDASISGTTLTFSDASTASLSASGTASIVDGAGEVDSNGNSSDWRNDVLKINANSTAPGNYIQFTSNPLADSAAAEIAKEQGVTISFWRYLEKNGTCTALASSGDPTGYPWRNAIAFDDGSLNSQGYYLIEVNGTNSICTTQGTNYYDYTQENQDPTGHAAGNNSGHWVNVVITIDPNSGIILYTNGEPHEMKSGYPDSHKGGTFSTMDDADVALAIIELITSGNMYFNYGDAIEGNDFDMYLDDIRIYTGVKTQVDINNMYIGNDADVQTDLTSTSHDPTNVTVYTLAQSVTYTATGTANDAAASRSITLAAGTTVGQEVIDYCGLDPTNEAQISAIDYYSFGTGMTVYHLNNTTGKWDVVGDSEGRCGYQNQKLFGNEYHTALAEPLAYAATDNRTGAGHLVWAPHVMFNLYTGTWVYYGSTSSWGSSTSAIFVCDGAEGGSIEGPYTYRQIVYKSSSHPNAIDPCVYYGYDSNNKPVTNQLYMAFGSWGGTSCIALKTLYADGDGNSYTTAFDNVYLANGINSSLEGASDGGSGEGAWVTYDNGWYYLYVSYGQNTGSYVERVFRSLTPTSGFEDFGGISATDTTTNTTHGGQILSPFDMSNYDYTFVSTGHSSIYKAVNDNGEVVTVNAAHARPLANANHDWKALPDGALATRQSEVTGNITLLNQVAYTSEGWPVMMPYQYDGSDTVKAAVTADQLEGVYAADDLQLTEYYDWSKQYNYTIVADESDPNAAFEYGVDANGGVFKNYIVLSTGTDGTRYANYYTSKAAYEANAADVEYYGVVGKHGDEICISMVCTDDKEHTWTYRVGDIPQSDEVSSLGDSVSMDGVIYTHLVNDSYAKYGYEISDDFAYGTSSQHQGERCTTIKTTYPAKIDVNNPTAVYCKSDEELCKTGQYSGGTFSVTALNSDKWYYDDNGTTRYLSDAEAIAAVDNETIAASELHRLYGVTGYVSDYYFDSKAGTFAETGVSLIVSYNNVETNASYSEFEFCYVAPNPAMAHTVQGIRNQNSGATDGTRRGSEVLYDRFLGSYGQATDIISEVVAQGNISLKDVSITGNAVEHGTGSYNYAGNWGSSTVSSAATSANPSEFASKFTQYGSKVGINAGSYGLIEHNNEDQNAHTVSSNVVDADYYIDYSNTDNYDVNNNYGLITTTTKNGKTVPTGYAFDFRTSNIKWTGSDGNRRWAANSYVLTTGEAKTKLTLNSTYDSSKDTYVTGSSSAGNSGENRYTYGNYYWNASTYDSTIGAIFNTSDTANNEMDGLYSDDAFKISGAGTYSTNSSSKSNDKGNIPNKDTLSLNKQDGTDDYRKVVNGYYYNPTAYDTAYPSNNYYTMGLTRGLPLINSGLADTNAWNMHITFSGKDSVAKNADPGESETYRAEKYANFILEQGISIFAYQTYVVTTTQYILQEETYAYYNIGVHTCDKGAARTFVDEYLNKQLVTTTDSTTGEVSVTLDENGAPTVKTEGGNALTINPQNYTLASYQEYIDAIAELAWFVENPQNTTFADYAGSGSNASTEYTTAYDSSGNPIYLTTVAGDNIFDDGVSNVNTDAVQARLIQNVITAYENLFAKTDYTAAEDLYGKLELLDGSSVSTTVADIDTIKLYSDATKETLVDTISKEDYTDDSWEDFVQLIVSVSDAFNYDSEVNTGSTSWRSVQLSGSEYRRLTDILSNTSTSLLPAVDISTLSTTYETKNGLVTVGVETNGCTYDSWEAMAEECDNAWPYLNPSAGTYAKAQSITVDGDDIINGSAGEADFEYTEGQYAVTSVTKYTFDDVTFYARNVSESLSDEQTAVNTENTALSGKTLTAVDAADKYATFDAAYTVVSGINADKYTAAGLAKLETALEELNNVYKVLNADEATYYNSKVGTAYTNGTRLKNTTTNATDTVTARMLSTANDLESAANIATYVKAFAGTVQVTDKNGTPITGYESPVSLVNSDRSNSTTFYYGDTFTVAIPEIAQGKCEISITYTDPYNENARVGSQKVNYNGASFSKNAVADMTVTIKLTDTTSSGTKVQVQNVYGTVVETLYATSDSEITALNAANNSTEQSLSLTIGGASETITAETIPFFTFTKWSVKTVDGTIVIKPLYDAKQTVTLTINNATGTSGVSYISGTSYTAIIDKYVTITNSSAYGWATYSNDKYQIASYGDSINLYAVVAETFYPIFRNGTEGNYTYTVGSPEGTELTASNVDVKFTVDDSNLAADDLLNQKLTNKAPFVSLIGITTVTNGNKKFSSASANCRVTQNAGDYTEIGVIATSKAANMTDAGLTKGTSTAFKTSTVLPTGQYYYTLSTTGAGFLQVAFRGYIAYDLTYTAAGQTATLNVSEYSNTYIRQNSPAAA